MYLYLMWCTFMSISYTNLPFLSLTLKNREWTNAMRPGCTWIGSEERKFKHHLGTLDSVTCTHISNVILSDPYRRNVKMPAVAAWWNKIRARMVLCELSAFIQVRTNQNQFLFLHGAKYVCPILTPSISLSLSLLYFCILVPTWEVPHKLPQPQLFNDYEVFRGCIIVSHNLSPN